MPTTIDDKILTDSLYLNRFGAGQQKIVVALLKEMKSDLLELLAEDYVLETTKQRLNKLIKEADGVIDSYYNTASKQLDVESLFLHVADTAQAAVQLSIPVSLSASLPTVAHMRSLIGNIMFDGSPLSDWWEKQSADARFKMGGIIRQGILQGSEYNKLITPVAELLDISTRNATGLVHTSIQTVANDARMAVFEENSDVIKYLRWVSAMDSHVCVLCIGRSGKKWTVNRKPIGHKIPFQLPPIHFRDRCVMSAQSIYTPETSDARFTRASSIGQIDAKITFDGYLKRVSPTQVDDMLGIGRAKLWREGKITTAQLLDQTGRELTLKELKAKYD